MNKYVAMFRLPVASMEEWQKNTKPEDMKAQSEKMMSDMSAWMQKIASSTVEKGNPLGKTKTVSASGVADTKNDLNYYMVVQAESHDAAAQLFVDCPHVHIIPTSTIDVMEIPHMGM